MPKSIGLAGECGEALCVNAYLAVPQIEEVWFREIIKNGAFVEYSWVDE